MAALHPAWHCEISGTGPVPLVCVHGWCCEGAQFTRLAEQFSDRYQIFRPDLPGHGRTPLGDFQPGFDAYAEALAAWIGERELDRPVLLGHSMGGALALMTATRIPVRAVINLDGSLPAAPKTLAAQATVRTWLGQPDFRDRLAGALREGFFLPHERDGRSEEVIRAMCGAPEPVLRFLPETIASLDASKLLPKIQAPVLYVGAENPRFDSAMARTFLPALRLEHVRGTGHFLHLFAPRQVAQLTSQFLGPTGTVA